MSLAALWFVAGLLLMLSEFVIPGFVVFFFGVGALVAAVAALIPAIPFEAQGYVFVVASVLSLVCGRRWFRDALLGKRAAMNVDADDDGLIGATVEVTEAIEPPRTGHVSLHGTEWIARADRPLAKGAMATVVARDNITLTVK